MLTNSARDLGSPGRDDEFGAGEADAYAAVKAVIAAMPSPTPSSEPTNVRENGENAPQPKENLKENPPVATVVNERRQPLRPEAQ